MKRAKDGKERGKLIFCLAVNYSCRSCLFNIQVYCVQSFVLFALVENDPSNKKHQKGNEKK